MRFTSLRLGNWRNFRDAGPVPLQRRMFLIGPNACGKSNLLDAFRFLHDVAKPGGGLRYAVEESGRGGVSRIRCLAARRTPVVVIEVAAGEDAERVEWVYRLEFSQSPSRQPIVKHEQVLHRGRVVLDRPDADDRRNMAGEGPILLEEPELSLSPAIVRQIPSLFARVLRSGKSRVRQYIVSTHSWEMLEDKGVAPDEVLVLTPGVNGTEVKLAKAIEGVEEMVGAGLSLRDAVSSLAEPPDVHALLKVGV